MKISVIVPTYNRDEPLIKTLESLFRQGYRDFEIIVVDQSDKKFSKKEEFLKKHSAKIRYFSFSPPNAAAARNFGAKKAKGEILLFLDDDVECESNLLKSHFKNYEDKKVGAVVGRIVTVGQKEEPERKNVGRITKWGKFTGGWSSKIKQEIFDAITCNASWRKSVFEEIGGFDENFSGPIREDSDLAIRTQKAGWKIIFEPEAQLTHLRAESGGFRKTEGRLKWYFGFFKSETYFAKKWIKWYWWSVFWLIRWQWFLRCMFGRERSWRSVITPFLGMKEGIKAFLRGEKLIEGVGPSGRIGPSCPIGRKKIGIDAGCLGIKDERLKVGVYQVAFNLVKELGRLAEPKKEGETLLYSFLPIETKVVKEFGPQVKNVVVKPTVGWNWFALPLRILKDKPDVFLGLSQSLPRFCFCPAVVFVYDIAFEHYPSDYADYQRLHKNTQRALKMANLIITLSLSTKKDLEKFFGIPGEKIKVVYGGVDSFFKPKKKLKKSDYFLFVGALKPIKNIPRILEAYAEFLKRNKSDIRFVFAGGDLWLDKKIKPTVEKLGLKEKVDFLGYVPRKKLIDLYSGAVAFVSPSLYEGFGLTLLEAQACGCPVIAGNTGSQPEVVGEAGILVDPKKPEEIAKAMEKIVKDKSLRKRLIKKGFEQVKNFSWKKFGEEVWQTINSKIS